MVRLLLYCVLGLIFLFQPILAWSNDLTALHEHLNSGEYEKVYELGTTLETSKGYAFAAEALARQVMLGEAKNLKKSSKEARKLAKKSLELDQMNQNALLQHAITDGFVARLSSDVSAWMKKLPQKSFALIETYRDTYPDDARGDALLGAWHLGVARKAGDSNAQKWFGASISEGQRLYDVFKEISSIFVCVIVFNSFAITSPSRVLTTTRSPRLTVSLGATKTLSP